MQVHTQSGSLETCFAPVNVSLFATAPKAGSNDEIENPQLCVYDLSRPKTLICSFFLFNFYIPWKDLF